MADRRAAALLQIRRKRREAADFLHYAALVATPETAAFQLPANGFLAAVGPATGGEEIIIGTRTFVLPILGDGEVLPLGWFERGREASGDTDTRIAALDEDRRPHVIAEFA